MRFETVEPQVRLVRGIAAALEEFAAELLRSAQEGDQEVMLVEEEAVHPSDERLLGKRQRQVVDLPGLATQHGMKTAEIAEEIGYDPPNTYTTLRALASDGIVEMVLGESPQRWRLAGRYRHGSEGFLRLASRVKEGEWTTYGDISIALRGDNKAARAVGRAAAVLPSFPNPHRVLMEGGLISETWRDGEGRGPEECRHRLESEGLTFDDRGRADPSKRLPWDELHRRDSSDHET